jgi:hypothetical protein
MFIDRPHEKGRVDLGPMGGEFFLASIGGCFNEQPAGRDRRSESGHF